MRYRSGKTAEFLARHPEDRPILLAAATDTSALGTIDAIREARRERHVAAVGQDCIAEAIAGMKRPRSSMIGSISHEAASYGPAPIVLGISLLRGQTLAPCNYVTYRTANA